MNSDYVNDCPWTRYAIGCQDALDGVFLVVGGDYIGHLLAVPSGLLA